MAFLLNFDRLRRKLQHVDLRTAGENFGTITLRDSLQSLPMQSIFYRVSHLPVERIALTLCSRVFPILPGLLAIWQIQLGKMVEHPN